MNDETYPLLPTLSLLEIVQRISKQRMQMAKLFSDTKKQFFWFFVFLMWREKGIGRATDGENDLFAVACDGLWQRHDLFSLFILADSKLSSGTCLSRTSRYNRNASINCGLKRQSKSWFFTVAGHFVAEHYIFNEGQETYSYYGPFNWIGFNVGYHIEHHDLPFIACSRLPTLKRIAFEFYDEPHYQSWVKVLWDFVFDSHLSPFARMKRRELSEEERLQLRARGGLSSNWSHGLGMIVLCHRSVYVKRPIHRFSGILCNDNDVAFCIYSARVPA